MTRRHRHRGGEHHDLERPQPSQRVGQPSGQDAPPGVAKPESQFNARILIAEDNKTNQVVAAGMLRRLGCTSAIARSVS